MAASRTVARSWVRWGRAESGGAGGMTRVRMTARSRVTTAAAARRAPAGDLRDQTRDRTGQQDGGESTSGHRPYGASPVIRCGQGGGVGDEGVDDGGSGEPDQCPGCQEAGSAGGGGQGQGRSVGAEQDRPALPPPPATNSATTSQAFR